MTNLTMVRLLAVINALRFRLENDKTMTASHRDDTKLALKWAREQHDRRNELETEE